jgi:hypothetical protein
MRRFEPVGQRRDLRGSLGRRGWISRPALELERVLYAAVTDGLSHRHERRFSDKPCRMDATGVAPDRGLDAATADFARRL